jgi:NADP-dependent 3-hydroxy acid dehydrogenase YdfG
VGAAGKDNMAQIIARRFADEGAVVAVAGRHMDSLQALALDKWQRALLRHHG